MTLIEFSVQYDKSFSLITELALPLYYTRAKTNNILAQIGRSKENREYHYSKKLFESFDSIRIWQQDKTLTTQERFQLKGNAGLNFINDINNVKGRTPQLRNKYINQSALYLLSALTQEFQEFDENEQENNSKKAEFYQEKLVGIINKHRPKLNPLFNQQGLEIEIHEEEVNVYDPQSRIKRLANSSDLYLFEL
jgi:hypothetical protein